MLLRLGVENHLSVSERQELSFAASSLKDCPDALISCDAAKSGTLVPAAVIYGANGSGKTNFVNAFETMQKLVLWSHAKGEPGRGVTRHEFRLDQSWLARPSCFDIDFVMDGIRYHYGFEATDEAFTSEWLYEIPKAHRRRMFERNEQKFEFGRWLKGQNNSIAGLTRSNSLFLSAAAQNGHAQLSRIYRLFQEMRFTSSTSVSGFEASKNFMNSGSDDRVIDFLKAIDANIVGYGRNETEVREVLRALRRGIATIPEGMSVGEDRNEPEQGDERIAEIELAHRGKGGSRTHLDLNLESAGTLRLLVVLGHAFNALDKGLPLFVDELDASLHSLACEAVVRLFCSPKVNRKGAQLIATTHDINLMRSTVLRRDQFWFAEKNAEGATAIFPLTDISTRKGDNIQLGYLQGRYGAVPVDDPVAAILESC